MKKQGGGVEARAQAGGCKCAPVVTRAEGGREDHCCFEGCSGAGSVDRRKKKRKK